MNKDEELSYAKTLKDIEITLGAVPSFLRTLPVGMLVQEWPLFKQHQLRTSSSISLIPGRSIGSAIAPNVKCSYCQRFHLGVAKTTMMRAAESEPSKDALFASLLSRRSFLQL